VNRERGYNLNFARKRPEIDTWLQKPYNWRFCIGRSTHAFNHLGYKFDQDIAKSLLESGFQEASAEPVKSGVSEGGIFQYLATS